VRPEAARRLGTIIGVLLLAGTATALVRASHDSGGGSINAQSPETLLTTTSSASALPTAAEPTTPTTPATAAGTGTPTPAPTAAPAPTPPTPAAGSGLSTSGSGTAANPQHPTTGGPLPLAPGLGIVGAAVLLRKKRSLFFR
jgi:hypothetical protein